MHRGLLGLFLAVLLGQFVAGCGGGGGSNNNFNNGGNTSTMSVSGRVVAGAVSGATVKVFQVNADRSLTLVATGTTSADGSYTLTPPGTGPFLLVASGGSFKDEATGQTRSLPSITPTTLDDARTNGLEAFLGSGLSGSAVTVSLTPLSTLASRRVAAASASDPTLLTESKVSQVNLDVARELGITQGGSPVDPRSLVPLDLTDPAQASMIAANPDSPAAKLGAVLAGLSQTAANLGLSDPLALVEALSKDFSDGSLNGSAGGSSIPLGSGTLSPDTATTQLSDGVTDFLSSTNNASGTTSSSFTNLVQAVSTQDVTTPGANIAPSFAPVGNQSGTVGTQQTVSLTGVTAGSGEDGTQTLTVTVTTSSASVVPVPVVSGSGSTRTLTFTPAAVGTATLTVTIKDSGGTANGGVDTVTRTFVVTVTTPPPPPPPPTGVWDSETWDNAVWGN